MSTHDDYTKKQDFVAFQYYLVSENLAHQAYLNKFIQYTHSSGLFL